MCHPLHKPTSPKNPQLLEETSLTKKQSSCDLMRRQSRFVLPTTRTPLSADTAADGNFCAYDCFATFAFNCPDVNHIIQITHLEHYEHARTTAATQETIASQARAKTKVKKK